MGKKVPPDWSELGDDSIGKRRWRIGPVEFDEVSRELRRSGERVAVEPKPLDCLMALLRRRNEVVLKQDLCRWVWSGRTVSESVLTKSMAKLRDALGDDEQVLIKTVHGLGYRLVANVNEIEAEDSKLQLRPRHLVPRHPELRLLRVVDEKRGLWSGERVDDLAPRVLILGSEPGLLAELRQEVRFYRKLQARPESAPFAVPICEWELDQAPYFIAREPMQALALPDWLVQNQRLTTARTDERVGFFADICEAVAAVHAAGLHFEGGLNPDCFLLQGLTGRPMQMQVCTGHSATWTQLGRPLKVIPERYAAPELQEGVAPSAASDIYALGVIGYHLLTGRWSAAASPGWEASVPDPQIVDLLTRAMHQSLGQRLGSARELAQMLRELPQTRAAAQLTRQAQAMAMAQATSAPLVALEAKKNPLDGGGMAVNARPWWIITVLCVLGLVMAITQCVHARDVQASAARVAAEQSP
jgi:non-specific serine/threonine protein kinase